MMAKFKLASIAVFAGISFANPVLAAPVEQLACVEETMGFEAVKIYSDASVRLIISHSMKEEGLVAPDPRPVVEASLICAKRFKWTHYETENAAIFAATSIFNSGVKEELVERGVDVDSLNLYMDLYTLTDIDTEDLKNNPIFRGMSDIRGMSADDEQLLNLAAFYIVTNSLLQKIMQDFATGAKSSI